MFPYNNRYIILYLDVRIFIGTFLSVEPEVNLWSQYISVLLININPVIEKSGFVFGCMVFN